MKQLISLNSRSDTQLDILVQREYGPTVAWFLESNSLTS